jgi:hypothetical protein
MVLEKRGIEILYRTGGMKLITGENKESYRHTDQGPQGEIAKKRIGGNSLLAAVSFQIRK